MRSAASSANRGSRESSLTRAIPWGPRAYTSKCASATEPSHVLRACVVFTSGWATDLAIHGNIGTSPSEHPMIRIPITLARRPGYEHEPQSFVSPVIPVTIAAIPEAASDGIIRPTIAQPTWALLDSGADLIGVDERLLQRIGAMNLGPDGGPTKTIHGEHTHDTYLVNLLIPGVSHPIGARVTGLPYKDNSRAYEVIFGMAFLKLGRFVLDAAGESYFELRS